MREVVIVSGCRTAVGNFGGNLKSQTAVQLGAVVMEKALKRSAYRVCHGAEATCIHGNLG